MRPRSGWRSLLCWSNVVSARWPRSRTTPASARTPPAAWTRQRRERSCPWSGAVARAPGRRSRWRTRPREREGEVGDVAAHSHQARTLATPVLGDDAARRVDDEVDVEVRGGGLRLVARDPGRSAATPSRRTAADRRQWPARDSPGTPAALGCHQTATRAVTARTASTHTGAIGRTVTRPTSGWPRRRRPGRVPRG